LFVHIIRIYHDGGQQNFKKPCYMLANFYWKIWDIVNETIFVYKYCKMAAVSCPSILC